MRRLITTIATLIAIGTIAGYGQTSVPWNLVGHTVATDLRGAYDVAAADINKDGRVDLVAVAGGTQELAWFENPSWAKHVIVAGVQGIINVAPFDVDRDGYPELVLQSGFSTVPAKGNGVMTLLTKGAEVTAPWAAKEFDRMPSVHRVRWIDADGSGRKMIVNAPLAGINAGPPDYKDKVSIYAYDPVDLKRQTITDAEEGVVHGLRAADWDGNGREALLTASMLGVHVHRFANGKWSRTRLVAGNPAPWPQGGAGEVAAVRSKAGRILATIEPFHGNTSPWPNIEVVVYRGKGDAWGDRTVIDNTLNYGHTLLAIDLDGDGADELVAGSRGKPNGINIYRLDANNTWTKTVLEENGLPGSGCIAADFNNDKRMDLACTGGSSLKWYENQPAR